MCLLGMEGVEIKEKSKEDDETRPCIWKKAKKKETAWYRVVERTLLARCAKCGF